MTTSSIRFSFDDPRAVRRPAPRHRALLLVAAMGIATATPDLAGAQAEHCSVPNGFSPLSSCRSGPAADVVIGGSAPTGCKSVFVDRSFLSSANDSLGKITIESDGILLVAEKTLLTIPNLQIDTRGIVVKGVLEIGNDQCPIGSNTPTAKVTVRFLGSRPNCNDLDNCSDPRKGIDVLKGGTLRLMGRRGVPANGGVSWTVLSEAAGPEDRYARKTMGGQETKVGAPVPPGGGKNLQLAADVSRDWQEGDWIAVGTTSFSPYETEFVQIGKPMKMGGGSVVPLVQALKYYHFGGPDPGAPGKGNYLAPRDKNYGVDERAAVALMSRNIKLTADIPSAPGSVHWGGELRFLRDFAEVSIQGVEIEKFGKDILGSYPVHFHMDGDVRNRPLVDANAIHHTYNKCITVHSTQNIKISNNACARVVGHIYYQEIGDESGTRFENNLGLGAMSNNFDVNAPSEAERQQLIKAFWWAGDNMTNDPMSNIGYDGFRIPNTDNQTNPTHGRCYQTDAQGALVAAAKLNPTCDAGALYTEPASGFWIINPTAQMVGNSIHGCQGVGRGIWYVPPEGGDLKFKPIGEFRNNRANSCYAGLYAEAEYSVVSGQLLPRVDGKTTGQPLITQFNGLTAARNRFRGVWLRPTWFVLKDARLATNRESASLVTAGGADGLAPGVWGLMQDSVLVGVSRNNVDRFGPCPYQKLSKEQKEGPGQLVGTGGEFGCIDQTPRTAGGTVRGGDEIGLGYPDPHWNLQGYMIYDGPTRIFNDRFVNFNVDLAKNLTAEDIAYFAWYSDKFKLPNTSQNFIYEGDAAFGWFQSNFSSYPTSTAAKGLVFENVDLRHQIYTEEVNLGPFHDGDKNTAVLDLDGTLTGFKVVDAQGMDVHDAYPISLNNLEFNLSSNGVDECLAEGGQDTFFEGRPTSLISPGSMATLEFTTLFPNPGAAPNRRHDQVLTFTKDNEEFVGTPLKERPTMTLEGRNGNGLWEPKVSHGYGYTVTAAAGIADTTTVGLVDAVKPDEIDPMTKLPVMNYAVRLGVCYTDASGNHPDASAFTVTRGYKSYGGTNVDPRDTELQQYWNLLFDRWDNQRCKDKDNDNPDNLKVPKGCPAEGVTAVPTSGTCPAGSRLVDKDQYGQKACIYGKTTMTQTADIKDLTASDGTAVLDKFFYDKATGMLYFNVAQGPRNAVGPSPLGDCGKGKSNAACPNVAKGEAYYPCPAEGCWIYRVDVSGYTPGPSRCNPYPKFAQDPPAKQLQLAYATSNGAIVKRTAKGGKDNRFPHYVTDPPQVCKVTASSAGSDGEDLGTGGGSSRR